MFCFWTYMVAFLMRVSSGETVIDAFPSKTTTSGWHSKKNSWSDQSYQGSSSWVHECTDKIEPTICALAVEIFLSWLNQQPDSSSNWHCPPPSHAANTAKNPSDVYGTVYTFMHDVMLHGKTRQEATVFTPLDELLYAAVVPLPHPSHPSCENEFICITANIMVLRGWERGSPNMQDGTIKKKPLTLMKMYTI